MILLTGVTGRTGRHILELALADGQAVRAIVRDPAKASALQERGVEVVVGDLGDPAVVQSAMAGVERALLLAANTAGQLDQELGFIDAAESAGVGHVVKMSAIGADSGAAAVLKRYHGTAEDRLRSARLTHTILQPNFFMNNLLYEARAIAAEGRFYLPMGTGRVGPIDVRDVAEALYVSLVRPGQEGRTCVITGPERLSFADMASVLSAELGRDVRYVDLPPAEFRERTLAVGMPAWNVDAVMQLFALISEDRNAEVNGAFQSITGRPPRTLREFVQDHRAAFAGT